MGKTMTMTEVVGALRGMRGSWKTYEDMVAECCDIADEIERALAERYVELPTDLRGEYWHIGDKSECCTVTCMLLREDGWSIDDGDCLYNPATMRRVTDSWELIVKDAIREGMERQRSNYEGRGERPDVLNNSALVARCKALAGDGR